MPKFRRLPNYRQIPKTVRWFYLRMAGRSGLSDSTELSIPALRLLSRPSVHDGGSLAGKLSARVSSIISSESSLSSRLSLFTVQCPRLQMAKLVCSIFRLALEIRLEQSLLSVFFLETVDAPSGIGNPLLSSEEWMRRR